MRLVLSLNSKNSSPKFLLRSPQISVIKRVALQHCSLFKECFGDITTKFYFLQKKNMSKYNDSQWNYTPSNNVSRNGWKDATEVHAYTFYQPANKHYNLYEHVSLRLSTKSQSSIWKKYSSPEEGGAEPFCTLTKTRQELIPISRRLKNLILVQHSKPTIIKAIYRLFSHYWPSIN